MNTLSNLFDHAPTVKSPADISIRTTNIHQELNIFMVGIGGLGLVTLNRHLSELLAERFAHVCSQESPGIAQQRGQVTSLIRASNGRGIYSPALTRRVDLMLGFESLETCRHANLLDRNSVCVMSDLQVKSFSGGKFQFAYPELAQARNRIASSGARLCILPLSGFLRENKLKNHYAGSVYLGAAAGMIGLDLERLHRRLRDCWDRQTLEHNQLALQWGYDQMDSHHCAHSAPGTTYCHACA